MKNRIVKAGIMLFVVLSLCGCEQVEQFVNMLNCTFERKDVDNFRFAGVNFDRLSSPQDLKTAEVIAITTALLQKKAPVTFNMNVEGSNPNKATAAIGRFKWILLLDSNEVVNGDVVDRFSIPAESRNILPIEMTFDAWKYLDGSTPESIFRFYQKISGKDTTQESKATLKIKPTINGVEFPNYITLN